MYLIWKTKTITNFTDDNINAYYNNGYLFARTGRGHMYQTRSLRVDLSKFILSSENKRVLKKTENIQMQVIALPHPNYHWSIHKMGKDFYKKKFGDKTLAPNRASGTISDLVFSANKINELMTNEKKSNFNLVFIYRQFEPTNKTQDIGYCIAFTTADLIHYCYPFYNLENSPKDIGMGMMLKAILYARDNDKKYIYLGSVSRPTDSYKLQFKGLEWYDSKEWKKKLDELKQNIKTNETE